MQSKIVAALCGFGKTFREWDYPEKTSNTVVSPLATGRAKRSTLAPSLLKAIWAMANGKIAIGETASGDTVIEWESGDNIDIIIYTFATGVVRGTSYDKLADSYNNYSFGPTAKGGTALVCAIMNELSNPDYVSLKNKFADCATAFKDINAMISAGSGTPGYFSNDEALMLSDFFYRQLCDDGLIKLTSQTLPRLTEMDIMAGKLKPERVSCGSFKLLLGKGAAAAVAASSEDFSLKRDLTDEEKAQVPEIPDWYNPSPEGLVILSHIKNGRNFRNFLLRGPAGTGKTMDAKFIANKLNLPYMLYTCSDDTDTFDLLGQMVPDVRSEGKDAPKADLDECFFDPVEAYKQLTGVEKLDATSFEAIEAWGKVKDIEEKAKKDFVFVESPIIKALRHGYVVEIQEPTVIGRPGVLVALNSLLDGGCVQLATGEKIKRHPDTVVILTANVDYNGCRQMNQSVISRMDLLFSKRELTPAQVAKRICNRLEPDAVQEVVIGKMTEVAEKVRKHIKENGIVDGVCGYREVLSWAKSYMVTGDPVTSAGYAFLSKVTDDFDEQDKIMMLFIENSF